MPRSYGLSATAPPTLCYKSRQRLSSDSPPRKSCPAQPSQPPRPAPLLSFWLPSAHAGSGGPPAAEPLRLRYVPPPGFPDPLGGFLPLDPGRAYLIPAALVGFTLQSLPLSRGDARVSATPNLPTVRHSPYTRPHVTRRQGRRRFPGFAPRKSPSPAAALFTPRPAGCSPGLLLSRVPGNGRAGASTGFLSRAFPAVRHEPQAAPQSLNAPLPCRGAQRTGR